MELKLKRFAFKNTYTVGKLYVDGAYFCDTIEDKDRGLDSSMTVEQIKAKKIASVTAIPTGRYAITLNVVSPKFKNRAQYAFCSAKLPRLIDVKGYDGVLIHIGNTAEESAGCILVGQNKVVGRVINSTETFKKLYGVLDAANKKGEKIYLTVEK